MPYTTDSANLPENVKALSDDKRTRWVAIWNRVSSECEKKDGDDCEGAAFRQANGVIFDEMALFTPPVMTGIKGLLSVQDVQALVEADGQVGHWARKIVRKLDKSEEIMEELMKTVAGKQRPRGDFLVVENPDEVSTWRLPVKVSGEVDRRLMGAAWAALHKGSRGQTYDGPDKAKAITKLKALYKAQDMPTPAAEAMAEMHDDEMPMVYTAGPTSFTDLLTAQRANEAAGKVQELTYQFQMLVGNIMNNETVTDKAVAIEQLALEFVDLISLELDEAVEESEPAETTALSEVAISESAVGHVTRLIETGDVVTGGSKPLLLEITPIKPGWGNVRDNNYYPASMLERCFAQAFDGVKMYETNHVDAETNNKNWVSTYVETSGFAEGAPVGVVGIHDPIFAQKVLNLIELEKTTGKPLLTKLECSIRADGSATPGFERDGRKGKRVQELSQGHSIDWVSRAGAGGHARRLLESEEEMSEKEDVKEEAVQAAVEPVEIAEKTVQAEPAEEEAQAESAEEKTQVESVTPQEVAPVYLSEQAVTALVPDHLPDETKARLLSRQFADEDEARHVITTEINYLMAVTNSGKPVMAEKQKAAPVVNVTELAEAQAARQSDVNKQFLGG